MWVIAAFVPAAWIILGVINPSMLAVTADNAYAQTYSSNKLTLTAAASCASGTAKVSLTWPAVTNATSYSVFRQDPGTGSWVNKSSKQPSAGFSETVKAGAGSYRYQVKTYTSNRRASYSKIVTVVVPTCAQVQPASVSTPVPVTVVPKPVATPKPVVASPSTVPAPVVQKPAGSVMTAYITGYGWPDNTPAGGAISNGKIHSSAGGMGTYADPITVAVGHSISGGKDTLDYPAGTIFYMPFLHRYFIVEDTCGDGNSPQNGPCHTGYQGHPWLDIWVGGQGASQSAVYACEDAVTDLHTVIKDPASNYVVASGPVFNNGSCAAHFSETATLQ